ncbi:hypothetical protein BgiMline_036728 [Biomphalaria glabrata]
MYGNGEGRGRSDLCQSLTILEWTDDHSTTGYIFTGDKSLFITLFHPALSSVVNCQGTVTGSTSHAPSPHILGEM